MRLLTLLLLSWTSSAKLGLGANVGIQTTQGKPLRALAEILQTFNPAAGWQAHGLTPKVARSPVGLVGGLPSQVASRAADMLMELPEDFELPTDDPRLITTELPRPTGIDFACDQQFRWPYVSGMDPTSAAARLGLLRLGDQLVSIEGNSVIGMSIDTCMTVIGAIPGGTVELTFFQGTREELQQAIGEASGHPDTVTITIKQIGKPDQQLRVPYGANLREELLANNLNIYQSFTRATNCQGAQRCGTCIVNVLKGLESCSVKSGDESVTLMDHPQSYKISCRTEVYGDMTIQIMPKIQMTQLYAR